MLTEYQLGFSDSPFLAPAQPWRFLFRTSARLPCAILYCNKLIYLACFAHPKWALETLLFGDVNQLIMLDMEPSDIWLTIISGIRWFLLDLLVYEFPTNCMFAEPGF